MLTQVIRSPTNKRVPLMVEVPIARNLDGPFLVSSTTGFLWVNDKFPSGVVRAAVRKVPPMFLFREAVQEVCEYSLEFGWGSVAPASLEGLQQAQGHLKEYGFGSLSILHDPGWALAGLKTPASAEEVSWLPAGWAIVVPADRAYLGTLLDFNEAKCALVLHNPSRGIAFSVPHG